MRNRFLLLVPAIALAATGIPVGKVPVLDTLWGSSAAHADTSPIPSCPPICSPPSPSPDPGGSPGDSSGTKQNGQGSHKKRTQIKGKDIVKGQGIATGCSSLYLIVDGGVVTPYYKGRALTPIEAATRTRRCGLFIGYAIWAYNKWKGIEDNACSYAVAKDDLRTVNTKEAREQRLWNDGSWERRNATYLARYHECYRGAKEVLHSAKKKVKKLKKKLRFRRR